MSTNEGNINFRELARLIKESVFSAVTLLILMFGGFITPIVLFFQFGYSFFESILYTSLIFSIVFFISTYVKILKLALLYRKYYEKYAEIREYEEKRTLGPTLYKQVEVQLEYLIEGNVWKSKSEVEIEILTDGVGIVHHYNREAASEGTYFRNYKCVGEVIKLPEGHDYNFEYLKRGSPPNAIDIIFRFVPPLLKGHRVRYRYTQEYEAVVPLTYSEAVKRVKMGRRITHKDQALAIKGYTILTQTDKLVWRLRFPKGYKISQVFPDVRYRGEKVLQELERINNTFKVQKVEDRYEVYWEIPSPKMFYTYFICWVPPKNAFQK